MTSSNENQLAEAKHVSTTDMVLDHQAMAQMHTLAELMSTGKSTVPAHLQKSPADCMAVIMQAAQWKMNPFAVAQKTHLVNGTLGYEAQLVNAVITSSRAINGRFHYEYGGDDWTVRSSGGGNSGYQKQQAGTNVNQGSGISSDCWVRVGAVLTGESAIQWGERLYPCTVGVKNSPLWKTNPKQQSAYLALKYWARMFAPAVILGVYTNDELMEVDDPQPEKQVNDPTGQFDIETEPSNAYPAETFEENLPKWHMVVSSGKKTAKDLISMIETKGQLTEEQKDRIKNASVIEGEVA